MTLLAKYSRVALLVAVCLIGLAAAQEAATGQGPGVASLSGDMQSELAEITKTTIDELKAMPLGKEGMNYICGYMTEAAPDGAEPESSAAWPWDNWQCKLACAGAGTGAALACTSVVACIPGVMGSIATCSQCPDILCYQPTVLAVAGTVCMTNACGSLSGGVKDACDTVCDFCNYN